MVALDPLLQVLADVVHRRARQQAGFPALCDGGWVGTRTIGADPVRGEQRLICKHLAKEALGGVLTSKRTKDDSSSVITPLRANTTR